MDETTMRTAEESAFSGAEAAPETAGGEQVLNTGGPETEDAAAPDAEAETRAEGERARMAEALTDLRARVKRQEDRLVRSEAGVIAAKLGVKGTKIETAVRMADLGGIHPDAEDAAARIEWALNAVLRETPELLAGAGTGGTIPAGRRRMDAFERGFLGNR